MAESFDNFGDGITALSCLFTVMEEPYTIFIAKAPITKHIMFIHHFTNIGGTRTMLTSKRFILSGTTSTAFPAQVNKENLFDQVEFNSPCWTSFKALKGADGVPALTACENAATKQYRMCCPVPLFLASDLIHQGGTSIPELIVVAVNQIRSYDEEHKDDTNFTKADTHCQNVVNWLRAAMVNSLIKPVLTTYSIYHIIVEKNNEIHKEWMHPAETPVTPSPNLPNDAAFTQLATNIAEQTTVLKQLNNLTEQKAKDKQKGISSVHPSLKKMILAASSKDGADVNSEPVKLCSDFFSQKAAVHAQSNLL